jgi:ATP-binding protein involved in chromosome partitioning
MASDYKVAWLGSLPLSMSIRIQADSGSPTVISAPDSEAARLYRDIASRIACRIATLPKDMSAKFPTVVVKRDQ